MSYLFRIIGISLLLVICPRSLAQSDPNDDAKSYRVIGRYRVESVECHGEGQRWVLLSRFRSMDPNCAGYAVNAIHAKECLDELEVSFGKADKTLGLDFKVEEQLNHSRVRVYREILPSTALSIDLKLMKEPERDTGRGEFRFATPSATESRRWLGLKCNWYGED